MRAEPAFAPSALLDTLAAATSTSDAVVLQQANQQLDSWEADEAYWLALIQVAFDTSHASRPDADAYTNLRRLAIIRFKNGVLKFWRPRVLRGGTVKISDATKEQIRTQLLQVLHEADRTIALQAAVAIARIARIDYPNDWPKLIPMMREAIEAACASIHRAASAGESMDATAQDTLLLLRASDVLRQCLKEFETVRVLAGKLRMTDLARTLLPMLQPAFEQLFADTFDLREATAASVAAWSHTPGVHERIRACHLLFKVLHRLALADTGIISVQVQQRQGKGDNLAYTFFVCTPRQLETLTQLRLYVVEAARADAQLATLVVPLTKYQTVYAKFHLALVNKMHNKVAQWPGWSDVAWWYWTVLRTAAQNGAAAALHKPEAASDEAYVVPYPYRWIVLSLVIVRTTLMSWRRNRPADSPFVGVSGAHFEVEMVDVLLGSYLRLTSDDLMRWQESPEEFAIEEAQADADLDIRPAAESLLKALSECCVRSVRSGVTPEMVPNVAETVFERFHAARTLDCTALDAVLARDAIYTALGLCRDQLDPNLTDDDNEIGGATLGPDNIHRMADAIRTRLVPEAMMLPPTVEASWVVIRRRIAWLLWEWSDQVLTEMRPDVYGVLVQLLAYQPGRTDAAVQLAAARSLMALADTVEFDAELFEPFLGDALAGLVHLIADGELTEVGSIRTVASTLSVLIERMGARTAPYAPRLVQLIPTLWAHDDPEARAKPSILEFLGKLAIAVGPSLHDPHSPVLLELHTIVAHVVRDSLTPSLAPLLGYDALLLFAHALQATQHLSSVLFSLTEVVVPLVLQPDYAPLVCRIWEELCLLAPVDLLERFGAEMYAALGSLFADRDSPVVVAPLGAIESHLRTLAAEGRAESLRYFVETLHSTNLFAMLVATLLRDEESAVIATKFVCLLSRLAYSLPTPYFHELVRASAPVIAQALDDKLPVQSVMQGAHPGALWTLLLPVMIRRVENMGSMRKMKITALGIANILRGATSAEDADVLRLVPEMVGVWTDVLGQVVEDPRGNSLLYEREQSPDQLGGSEDLDDELELGLLGSVFGALEDTSPTAKRSEQLMKKDPVVTEPLRPYISASLNMALAVHPQNTESGAILHHALASIDPLVIDVLHKDLEQPPAS
ncbi:hypothetical protein MBRA1_001130 [Malassezia brasiliensis]|uniref:Importin N-terminal domain-containing protein n=1 Tax=Malassezia brasiliensis TaxID=1821822 RepID=A0AAF0IP42_9BASI|nr:hypothetical protein MBRA1_001130 [Malassezia brasiliensis]